MRLTTLLALGWLITAPAWAEVPLGISFGELFAQPIGPRGLEPSAKLRAAAGQQVRIVGFMVRREHPQAGRFLLTPRPVSMAEHADGEADDLPPATFTVMLPESQRDRLVAFQPGPIALTGRLELGPAEDDTGRVTWLRLHLDTDALAATPTRTQAP